MSRGFTDAEIAEMEAAIGKLERDGVRFDGSYGTNDGPVCMIGAVRWAVTGKTELPTLVEDQRVYHLLSAVVEVLPRAAEGEVTLYNDLLSKKKPERVIGKMRQALHYMQQHRAVIG